MSYIGVSAEAAPARRIGSLGNRLKRARPEEGGKADHLVGDARALRSVQPPGQFVPAQPCAPTRCQRGVTGRAAFVDSQRPTPQGWTGRRTTPKGRQVQQGEGAEVNSCATSIADFRDQQLTLWRRHAICSHFEQARKFRTNRQSFPNLPGPQLTELLGSVSPRWWTRGILRALIHTW